jgi:predicted 2-oxoglutarate/Fe(II)-dependent dioxygenase YbiX
LKTRLDVRPEEGMLLAFPPDLLHEVSRVTRGERFAAVSWYV